MVAAGWLLPWVINVCGMKSDVNSHPSLPPLFECVFTVTVLIPSFIDLVKILHKIAKLNVKAASAYFSAAGVEWQVA